jgi:hypothetical protein
MLRRQFPALVAAVVVAQMAQNQLSAIFAKGAVRYSKLQNLLSAK